MLPSQPNCDPAPHGLPSCSCSGHRRPDIASSKGGETLSLLQSLPPSVRQSRAQGAAQPTRNRPPPRGQVPLLQRAAATPRPGVCSSPRVPAGPFEAALPCKTSLRSSLPSNLPPAGTLPPPARQYRLTLPPPPYVPVFPSHLPSWPPQKPCRHRWRQDAGPPHFQVHNPGRA